METVLLVVAGGAVVLAVVIAIVNKMKGSPAKEERPAGSPVAKGGARFQANAATDRAVAERAKKRKQRNKRGWRAPEGHYFDDDDCLFTDAGDAILDLVMMAQLCGESYDPSEESAPTEEFATGVSNECTAASCCSEASAEVTSKTDFSSLQTETTRPEPSHSAPEPSYSGGGGGDSYDDGGCDD